jgi:hypothetical protein
MIRRVLLYLNIKRWRYLKDENGVYLLTKRKVWQSGLGSENVLMKYNWLKCSKGEEGFVGLNLSLRKLFASL